LAPSLPLGRFVEKLEPFLNRSSFGFGRPLRTVLLELNSRQVMFALSKIHGMLACERRLEATRDTKFVERRRRA
jgi:hypothetical protein